MNEPLASVSFYTQACLGPQVEKKWTLMLPRTSLAQNQDKTVSQFQGSAQEVCTQIHSSPLDKIDPFGHGTWLEGGPLVYGPRTECGSLLKVGF